MRAVDDRGVVSVVVAIVLAVVIGAGAAVGLSMGLVSVGSKANEVNKPLVTYNAP